jgi:hypothetical protein
VVLVGFGPIIADMVQLLREIGEHDAQLGPADDEAGAEAGGEKKQG